ncbi:AAA family ATPase [Pseudomonas batumici]|uniref:Endonuclease GajA/Old nuclease/RecF-like AAA domain-containing protein n=1 Tax=Pseudomonas batumici TaxID=226910 RepID=A0A0C2EXQ0_9PSED|nr:AAA family ATPase [Pseudomonas batumici]KIH83558.1 hypothetical protein UCMB321_2684 [Pseudomonas batumici]
MESLRIKNLRSLSDTGKIQFKKINVFLGQNSSGKSSFIRTLPLLKQSAQVKTLSEILWYGPLVDFGSFDEALSRYAEKRAIEFGFELSISNRTLSRQSRFRHRIAEGNTHVELGISIRPEKLGLNSPLSTEYSIRVFENDITLAINEKLKVTNFTINNEDYTSATSSYLLFRSFNLLPNIIETNRPELRTQLHNSIIDVIKKHTHKNKQDENIGTTAARLYPASPSVVLEQLKVLDFGTHWKYKISSWTADSQDVQKITALLIAKHFCEIFEGIAEFLSRTCHAIQYVTPLRASAERYYRIQGLAVDEIDPQGNNLAMFLKNLSVEESESFAKWTGKTMGFEVRAKLSEGHVSIVLSERGGKEKVNLADTGFGYSQVLPIIAQLWTMTRKKNYGSYTRFFAIEQPELHLHPKMQAKLADLFASLIKEYPESNFKIAIETHSEVIINQLGKSIEEGTLSTEDVGVYLFDQGGLDDSTIVRESTFDKDGYLSDWPIGFFDSEAM